MVNSGTSRLLGFLILTVLLISFFAFPRNTFGVQLTNGANYTVGADNNGFTVPVTIQTTGNAWNGYLAFGLWQFSPIDLSPLHSYLVVMTTNGQLLYLRESNDIPSYWPVKYVKEDTLMFMG